MVPVNGKLNKQIMYKIHLLPAAFGDAILIIYGNSTAPKYILIDGGPVNNFNEFYRALKAVAPQLKELELLVVTHIDIDHIDGIVKLLNQSNSGITVKQIWFNGRKQLVEAAKRSDLLGSLQGEYITQLIEDHNLPHNIDFENGMVVIEDISNLPVVDLADGMRIIILAPQLKHLAKLLPKWDEELDKRKDEPDLRNDKRYADLLGNWIEDAADSMESSDSSLPNKSSISFLASYKGKSCLFAGDTPGKLLAEGIDALLSQNNSEVLNVDAWKLAHHGSKASTNSTVIKKVKASHILISTNGARFKHPDVGPLARIVHGNDRENPLQLHFNYDTEFTNIWADEEMIDKYGYKVHYGDENGIGLELI
jgi:beta-lactamase superfamily II metal-dependent hydrolase